MIDQDIPGAPDFSTYVVSDVVFDDPSGAVVINSVTVYFSNNTGVWPLDVSSAILNIFTEAGGIPDVSDDPSQGVLVPVSVGSSGNVLAITASGLNEIFPNGSYWIGLSPSVTSSQEFHWPANSSAVSYTHLTLPTKA